MSNDLQDIKIHMDLSIHFSPGFARMALNILACHSNPVQFRIYG